MLSLLCPTCETKTNHIRSGYTEARSQIVECKSCANRYTLNPKPLGYSDAVRKEVQRQYLEGDSLRMIARNLNVTHRTIGRWVQGLTPTSKPESTHVASKDTFVVSRSDPRSEASRDQLRKALIQQMLDKDYSDIRIQDIVVDASVAKVTFYRHYKNKDDLLEDWCLSIIDQAWQLVQDSGNTFDSVMDLNNLPPTLIPFMILSENRILYQRLLATPVAAKIIAYTRQFPIQIISRDISEFTELQVQQIANIIIGNGIAWLQSDPAPDVERMAYLTHWTAIGGIISWQADSERLILPKQDMVSHQTKLNT